MTRPWTRPLCWVIGHRWLLLRRNVLKAHGLARLHPRAGEDSDCERCGARWRDFYGFGITPDNEHLALTHEEFWRRNRAARTRKDQP